jgi:hypothetical protein
VKFINRLGLALCFLGTVSNCKACRHYRPESGASGVYTYGKCVRIHTNANKALFWSHPIQEEVDYLPGDEVQVLSREIP